MALNVCLFGFCWGVLSNYLAIYSKECMHITEETGSFFLMLSVGLIVSRLQGQKSLREGRLLRNAFQGILRTAPMQSPDAVRQVWGCCR